MKNTNLKQKIGLFLIRMICVLLIVSGIAGFVTVSNGGRIAVQNSPRDHSYREVEMAEDAEGLWYSLGVVCMGGIGLLLTRRKK